MAECAGACLQRTAELRKASAQIKASQKETSTKADALAEAQARTRELEERLATQARELAALRDEQSHQRVLLPPGMEAELDADVADDRKGSQSSRAGGGSAPGADGQTRAFSPWDYRGAFAPQPAAEGGVAQGGLRARGSAAGLHGSTAFAEAGKQESSASAPGGSEGGGTGGARAEDPNSRRGAAAAAAVSAAGVNPAAKPFIASARPTGSANPSPTSTRPALQATASYHSSPVSLPHGGGMDGGGHVPQRPLSQQQLRPSAVTAAPRQQPPPPPPQRGGQQAALQGPAPPAGRAHSSQQPAPPQWAYPRQSARQPPYLMSGNAQLSSLGFFESGPDSSSGPTSGASALGNSGGNPGASGGASIEKLPSDFLPAGADFMGNGSAMPGPLLQPGGLPRTASGFGALPGMARGPHAGKAAEGADGGLSFMLMGRNGQSSSQSIWGQPNGHPF